MLDTISTRGATTILDCMELEIVKIQIYRYHHEDDTEGVLFDMCVIKSCKSVEVHAVS